MNMSAKIAKQQDRAGFIWVNRKRVNRFHPSDNIKAVLLNGSLYFFAQRGLNRAITAHSA